MTSGQRKLVVLFVLVGLVLPATIALEAVRLQAFAHRTRHALAVSSLEFSADGLRLLSLAREERTFLVWEVGNRLDLRFGARTRGIADRVAFAPSGREVIVIHVPAESATKDADNNRMCIVDLATGNETWTVSSSSMIMALSPDGTDLATIVGPTLANPWTGFATHPFPRGFRDFDFHTETPRLSIDVSPDSRTVAAGGATDLAILERPSRQVVVLPSVQGVSVRFSRDGSTVYGGGDERLSAVDVGSRSLRWSTLARVELLGETLDGKTVIALGHGKLETFEPRTGARSTSRPAMETCFALSPDGLSVAVGYGDGTVAIEDLASFLAGSR